jgi:two-component system, OmpR family, sensor kinase
VSLRARLLVAMLLVTTAGLLVADVATYRYLASFLYDRIDTQLVAAAGFAPRMLEGPGFAGGEPPGDAGGPGGFSSLYVGLLDANGTVIQHRTIVPLGEASPSPPVLPSGLAGSTGGDTTRELLTVDSRDGTLRYRVVATPVTYGSASSQGTLVTAVPLTEVLGTLNRLVMIELLVTAGVLAMLVGMCWWLVRLGLRPLQRMGAAADAIAAGDLSGRVEPATARTEVGRLGLALNAMLERIEVAFAERRASEERLRRFVADASHELRTPLTSVRGYAELFRRGAADRPGDLERAMSSIEVEGARMADLVDELALLARLDQGRALALEDADLVAVAAAVVETARVVHPDRPIDLDTPASLAASVDRPRVRQILDNLIANAAEHTPEASPVHVRVRKDGADALLEVEDEGEGIPDEHAGRVFERFYRVDPSRSRGTGGSGLGLSIVAALAEAHGGSATYEPAESGGARFRVRLPLHGAQVDDDTGVSTEARSASTQV